MPLAPALEVARQLTPMLLPLVPYLVKGLKKATGEEFFKKLVEKGGEQAVKTAEKIWEKLKPKLDETPSAKETLESVSQEQAKLEKGQKNPENEQRLLEALLTVLNDPKLREAIVKIMQQGERRQVTLESYIEAGDIYGEVCGAEISDMEAMGTASLRSDIKAKDVKEGGVVTGIRIGQKLNEEPGKAEEERHGN